jgi:hypothetical protein
LTSSYWKLKSQPRPATQCRAILLLVPPKSKSAPKPSATIGFEAKLRLAADNPIVIETYWHTGKIILQRQSEASEAAWGALALWSAAALCRFAPRALVRDRHRFPPWRGKAPEGRSTPRRFAPPRTVLKAKISTINVCHVLANPPFNDSDRFRKDDDIRCLSLSASNGETGGVRCRNPLPPKGNANFDWVQHFIHHFAPQGMAGFVLANGSMSSNQSEKETRLPS